MASSKIQPFVLPGAIIIAAVLIAGSVLYTSGSRTASVGGSQAPEQSRVVDRSLVESDDDPTIGSADAPVTIVEFSDFQCPFCRIFWQESYPQLKQDYIDTGKARLIYRDFPLDFHPAAHVAAVGAQCANQQGKFEEYHDTVFGEQTKQGTGTLSFGEEEIRAWARQAGVDAVSFDACLQSDAFDDEIAQDMAAGAAAGVSGTPSFYVNGREIVGAQPYEIFQQFIEEELAK